MQHQGDGMTDRDRETGPTAAQSRGPGHMRWLAAGVLCLAGIGPSTVHAKPPIQLEYGQSAEPRAALHRSSTEELYRLGKKALGASRYTIAIRLLNQAAIDRPRDVELYYWLGVAYWNREQGEEAINSYRLAVELDADDSSEWSLYALENLAEVYTRTDHAEKARKTYRRAVDRETRPEWIIRIHNQIAELELALGDYQPDETTVYNERGEIIGGVGPGQMRTNRNFEIARQTNKPSKEEKYYRRAIDTDPQMYQSYFNLGLALVHQDRYQEAIPWLERSDAVWKTDSTTNPLHLDKTDAHAFLALCYLELGELEKAGHHSQLALATGDVNFWALLYAQRIKIAQGQASEALPTLEALAAENPEHAETLYALHLAYAALGRDEKAHETLIAAISSIPDNHPWMVRLHVLADEFVGFQGKRATNRIQSPQRSDAPELVGTAKPGLFTWLREIRSGRKVTIDYSDYYLELDPYSRRLDRQHGIYYRDPYYWP